MYHPQLYNRIAKCLKYVKKKKKVNQTLQPLTELLAGTKITDLFYNENLIV